MEWKLPAQSYVHKNVPKNTFYQHARVNTKLKQEFTDLVQKITWEYKLSPETIGVPKTEQVEELQIFTLDLKKRMVPKGVLTTIDRSVAYPILFRGVHEDHEFYAISLKVQGEDRWYISDWDQELPFRFTGMNLEAVYQGLIKTFIGTNPNENQDFATIVATDKKRQVLEREISALKNKIRSERQFNKKVELNNQLQIKQSNLEKLNQ
jgi:hypothetical protein